MGIYSIELPDKRVLDIEAADQDTAIRGAQEWHAANPQPELSGAETIADVGESAVRGFNRGVANVAMLPLRASAWLTGTQGSGLEGAAEDLLRPYLEQPAPRSRTGRYASSIGEAAGGMAIPSTVALQAASRLPAVAPAVGGLAERFLRPIATNPGTAATIDALASAGAGAAHEAAHEAGAGPTGETLASLAGGIAVPFATVPLAVASRRGAEAVGRAAANRLGIRASADDGIPNVPAGAQDAAEQVLADTLLRAGVGTSEIRTALDRIGEARRFWSSGAAQDVTALADLDESLMRLAGSIARQSPEAARIIRQFMSARQTGHTPEGLEAIDMAERGLPTRSPFTGPITGAQARRTLGNTFDTPERGHVPMGMVERVRDALRRAFTISDVDYHGHGLTGLRTEQRILRSAREAADANYRASYDAGQGVNLRDAIAPVFERHLADAAANEAPAVENLIRRVQGMFRSGPIELKQFDRTKRAVDDIIKRFLNRPDKSGVHMGGRLNDLKKDLLRAVDDATGGDASPYSAARNAFSSDMDMLNALRLGRQAFRENSEVTADAFHALQTEGERKLFRLGLLDSVTERGHNMPRGHDFTRVFQSPRVEEILTATIPRSQGRADMFADRPQRFGRYVDAQARTIEARNTAQGGSSTMRNAADDLALETLHAVALGRVTGLVSALRGSQSAWQFGERALQIAIDKAFGMRADVAKALAHMLFTADPVQRGIILQNVAQRMGPSRMARFNQLMQEYDLAHQSVRSGSSATLGTATDPQPNPGP